MKSIGNGQDTSIWADKWIVDDYPRRPINKELFMDLNLRVASLITPQGEWNLPRMQQLFPPGDVIQISSFPPAVNLKDRFVWAYTKDGKYSVKSGNWVLKREATSMEVISDNTQAVNLIKEKAWNIVTVPKIKLFFLRALSGALAVAECLRHHGLQTNPIFSLCRVEEETVSHVLFKCTLAAQGWLLSSLPAPAQGFFASVMDNIQHLLSIMKDESIPTHIRTAIPWILWEIWKARNSTLYAGKHNDGNILLATAFEEAEEWMQQHHNLTRDQHVETRRSPHNVQRWLRPVVGVLKCNVHASWVNDSAFCGGSWILRNHNGDALFHA
ncbi:uncharacterized protein LOC110229040 [Arabidopsis lyrata subsp. lyrata]|uniref:uncharacterized protein LOC110229040 n=1 Tax=Arabidopsis lyrata subsp. lyrata TaxID=81972 RepID=UPI000A29CD10|nr:uncharacterized protein LOC110229040 [Arabidopsis lyrata subsp. lyrata]|eukprot:XP_020883444.1 uncharacterized protein LOC110229040 [Arabidopsis lyrata subsp. lyrata]